MSCQPSWRARGLWLTMPKLGLELLPDAFDPIVKEWMLKTQLTNGRYVIAHVRLQHKLQLATRLEADRRTRKYGQRTYFVFGDPKNAYYADTTIRGRRQRIWLNIGMRLLRQQLKGGAIYKPPMQRSPISCSFVILCILGSMSSKGVQQA